MKENFRIELLQKLITEKEISKEINKRKSPYIFDSVSKKQKEILKEKYNEGWEFNRDYKYKIKIQKLKSQDRFFEDRVWTLFANMGFKLLNKDRNFHLSYDKHNDKFTQQIDVFAKDDETILLIECKSAISNKKGDFKKELEAMSGKIEGLMKTIKAIFPGQKLKFKYILATQNYAISKPDLDRLENLKGMHFDEESIEYYTALFQQLGLASKYQLLGSLFYGQEIPELDNLVPAIRGKMGGHVYYSFSIEPEKLLKIGYVLHRSKANMNMMPTYQRLIKKNRLKQIHTFIDEKNGYFPNSLILSIDNGNKGKLNFDKANTQVKSTISDIGILHLPKKYRSVYIIDGQHRLYGYANSEYKSTNTIPVVAFVDLERDEQIRLFMDINENQKAVSKNLRSTLRADLLWASESYLEQLDALRSRIFITLGESRKSPLFDKVSIGEDKKVITSEPIVNALKKSNFLGKVTKNKIIQLGTFYKGDLDVAFKDLSDYFMLSLDYLKENLNELWDSDDSILMINKGIFAIIKILGDIVDYLIEDKQINNNSNPVQIFTETKYYLDPVILFYKNISAEYSEGLKKTYGVGGDTKYWRALQKAIRDTHSEFNPVGLDEYLVREEREFNTKAFKLIREIESYFNKKSQQLLKEKFKEKWFDEGVPPKIQDHSVVLAQQKKRETGKQASPWDCLHVIDYREIAMKNWHQFFEFFFTRPEEKKISGGGKAKTKWIAEINRLRNQNFHAYYVTKEELDFIQEIYDWLFNQ